MAESVNKPMEFTPLEKGWIAKSLELQRSALIRSRGKEVTGSDIWTLRGKEVEALSSLLNRF